MSESPQHRLSRALERGGGDFNVHSKVTKLLDDLLLKGDGLLGVCQLLAETSELVVVFAAATAATAATTATAAQRRTRKHGGCCLYWREKLQRLAHRVERAIGPKRPVSLTVWRRRIRVYRACNTPTPPINAEENRLL